MEENKKKKSIWNRLLVVVIIMIAALIALVIYIALRQERELDLSFGYSAYELDTDSLEKADTFASDIAVSRNYEPLEGFEPTRETERILLVNLEDNKVLYANGIYERAYPASITKIMTAILAAKYANMDDVVTMQESDFDLEAGSQNSNMVPGDVVTMRQLFEVMLIYSANDATNAVARVISGSNEAFVELMNEEAKSLGMLGTHFVNPHGLHNDDHYTCAYDVYLMLNEAMNYQIFTETIRQSSYTLDVTRGDSVVSYYYESTDEFLTGLVSTPSGVNLWGGKTGTTGQAGACLSLIAQNDAGVPYIAVILNADKKTELYDDMSRLLTFITTDDS